MSSFAWPTITCYGPQISYFTCVKILILLSKDRGKPFILIGYLKNQVHGFTVQSFVLSLKVHIVARPFRTTLQLWSSSQRSCYFFVCCESVKCIQHLKIETSMWFLLMQNHSIWPSIMGQIQGFWYVSDLLSLFEVNQFINSFIFISRYVRGLPC